VAGLRFCQPLPRATVRHRQLSHYAIKAQGDKGHKGTGRQVAQDEYRPHAARALSYVDRHTDNHRSYSDHDNAHGPSEHIKVSPYFCNRSLTFVSINVPQVDIVTDELSVKLLLCVYPCHPQEPPPRHPNRSGPRQQ